MGRLNINNATGVKPAGKSLNLNKVQAPVVAPVEIDPMDVKQFSAFEAPGLGSDKQIKWCAPSGEHDDMVASFLQLAPVITMSGKRSDPPPTTPPEPRIDQGGCTTTLERWAKGKLPPGWKHDPSKKASWDSVILP